MGSYTRDPKTTLTQPYKISKVIFHIQLSILFRWNQRPWHWHVLPLQAQSRRPNLASQLSHRRAGPHHPGPYPLRFRLFTRPRHKKITSFSIETLFFPALQEPKEAVMYFFQMYLNIYTKKNHLIVMVFQNRVKNSDWNHKNTNGFPRSS